MAPPDYNHQIKANICKYVCTSQQLSEHLPFELCSRALSKLQLQLKFKGGSKKLDPQIITKWFDKRVKKTEGSVGFYVT